MLGYLEKMLALEPMALQPIYYAKLVKEHVFYEWELLSLQMSIILK